MAIKETKAERFVRLAEARTEKAIRILRLLGNCSCKTNYSYTDDQVDQIFDRLQKELNDARLRYENGGQKHFHRFSLLDGTKEEKNASRK